MLRTLLLASILLLPLPLAPAAYGFSSQAATCFSPAASAGQHSVDSGGTGGFTLVATSGGSPVTEVIPGQTIDLTLSRPGGYKGFLIRANEGSAGGTAVGGLATAGPGQQLEPACTLVGSGISHNSNAIRTSEVVSWTVPAGLAGGTTVVISAYPVVSFSEWYGTGGVIAATLDVAQPAPGLHPAMRIALVVVVMIVGASLLSLRSRRVRAR
jgi:hypothetical protein